MAVGDLVTTYNMYELNGIVLGHGTDFIVSKVEGLYGKTDTKNTDYSRMDAWGEYPGRKMYKGRTITFTLDVIGLPDPAAVNGIDANYSTLMAALALPDITAQPTPFQLVFYRPWPVAGKRFCWVYPDKAAVMSDSDWTLGHISCPVQLVANDPRHYSLEQYDTTINLAATGESTETSINNQGDSAAMPVINFQFTLSSAQWATLNGSTANLIIQNINDSSKSVVIPVSAVVGTALSTAGPGGGYYMLSFDMRQMSIKVNGVDISGSINASSRFWKLQPGENMVNINMGVAWPVPVTIDILHYDTWSG